jgi:diguanylate cyclase (GGDEF)-like protein/PAS domain S-box-containing protein
MCAFLALPVQLDGVNVALVGLANQPGGYSEADAAFLQPLLTAIAQIFRAWRMEAEQWQVQAALEEGEHRHRELADHLRAILGALPDPLFEIDAQGCYRYVSCTKPELLTRPAEQLLGRHYSDVLPPDAAEQLRLAVTESWSKGSSVGRQYHLELPGGDRWFELSVARKPGDGAEGGVVVLARDVSQRKRAEAEIERLAFHDVLTGLPNRRLLLDRLAMAIAGAVRHGQLGALLFIDLDNFKDLNDTLGHDHGDQLLQQVAQRLRMVLREADTVARLGGDEFVVMLEGLHPDPGAAAVEVEQVGRKVVSALNEPYTLRGRVHNSTPSVGVALFGQPGDTVDELLKRADLAMYRAKTEGRNTLRFYDPDMQDRVLQRALIEADLRVALQRNELRLFFQPVVDDAGHIVGAEALVRWAHPERGMVSPAAFVPVAEQTGLILPLGRWVLGEACRHLGAWSSDPLRRDWSLAVNVSAREFRHADFVAQVVQAMQAHGVQPGRLKLELTESMFLQDANDISHKMAQLKAQGVSFSLDDFGTGYSSLSYLKRLPLDQLKIDQSFVRDVLDDEDDAAIVRAILTLANSLGLAVVAEGVETDAQRQWLADAGCQAFQGYLFGRPSPELSPV